jgi:hypothetical protein
MWSVPSRKVTTSVPLAALARSSASAAEMVAGGLLESDWNESVGRISRLPSTAFTLIEICEVLYDRCCRSRP